jgi:hypothetical protein
MSRAAGYCDLCRAKEIELYGTVLSNAGPRHVRACREAGCWHPAVYVFRERKGKAQPVPAPEREGTK